MYTDSQEPLKLSSLARIVLLLAVLALAGCSASRPRSIGEAPPAARPAPPANYTIIFKGVPSRIVKVHLAGLKFLQTLCVGSLKSHNGTERPYQKTYRYTLCGNLTAERLERELKKELVAFDPRPDVSLVDKTFTISVPATLPILSPVELRFPGFHGLECEDGKGRCRAEFGLTPSELTPSKLEYKFPRVQECTVGCEHSKPEDIEYDLVQRRVGNPISDPHLEVQVPKGVISNINPVSRLCRYLSAEYPRGKWSFYPPKFVQVEREDGIDHIDVCWCRTKHPDYSPSSPPSYPDSCSNNGHSIGDYVHGDGKVPYSIVY